MTMTQTPALQGDYAELDNALFPADAAGQQAQTPVSQPEQGAPAQPSAPDPILERMQRLENTINSATRQMRTVMQQQGTVPEALTQRLDTLQGQLADLREQREMDGLTLEEQNAKLREKVAAKSAPPPPETPMQITRQEPWFEQAVSDDFHGDVTGEIREMAEDLGVALTDDHLNALRLHAIRGENQVSITMEGGKPYLEWDVWLRKIVRPALRQEAQRQAAEAKAQQQPSPARQSPAALGGGSRAAAGGTPQLDYFKSSNADEMNAAGWGVLR